MIIFACYANVLRGQLKMRDRKTRDHHFGVENARPAVMEHRSSKKPKTRHILHSEERTSTTNVGYTHGNMLHKNTFGANTKQHRTYVNRYQRDNIEGKLQPEKCAKSSQQVILYTNIHTAYKI